MSRSLNDRIWRRVIVGLALPSLFLTIGGISYAAPVPYNIGLSSSSGEPGSSTTASGLGCYQGTVSLTFTDSAGTSSVAGQTTGAADSSWSVAVTIPDDAATGDGSVGGICTLSGGSSFDFQPAGFSVVAGPTTVPPTTVPPTTAASTTSAGIAPSTEQAPPGSATPPSSPASPVAVAPTFTG